MDPWASIVAVTCVLALLAGPAVILYLWSPDSSRHRGRGEASPTSGKGFMAEERPSAAREQEGARSPGLRLHC